MLSSFTTLEQFVQNPEALIPSAKDLTKALSPVVNESVMQALEGARNVVIDQIKKYRREENRELKTYNLELGEKIFAEKKELESHGFDPNVIAGKLAKNHPEFANFGIGIMLENGVPMPENPLLRLLIIADTLLQEESNYQSAAPQADFSKNFLNWLRIPEKYHEFITVRTTGSGGTGGLDDAIAVAKSINESDILSTSHPCFPGYAALAAKHGMKHVGNMPGTIYSEGTPVYELAPHNPTGFTPDENLNRERAKNLVETRRTGVGDVAYPAFSYAQDVSEEGYEAIMQKNYQRQFAPYLEEGAAMKFVIGSTKAELTFSNRPPAVILAFDPEKSTKKIQVRAKTLRAGGTSFDGAAARALKAMYTHFTPLVEKIHQMTLNRTGESEKLWKKYTKGTALEKRFHRDHGIFILMDVENSEEAAKKVYGNEIIAVMNGDQIRVNMLGISSSEEIAKKQIETFANIAI